MGYADERLQLGVEVKVTRIKDYIEGEDWSELINRPAPIV